MLSLLSIRHTLPLLLFCTFCLDRPLSAQTAPQPAPAQPAAPKQPDTQIVTTTSTNGADEQTPLPTHDPKAAPAQKLAGSWFMLTTAVQSHNADTRIQALAALGTLGTNPRSSALIVQSMSDSDLDVRTAAILSAAQTKNRSLTTNIRNLLDDKEPQVAFAAAITLWKMNDRSGEDILLAVVGGDRSANPKLVNGTMHNVNKQLHHPGALAKMGAMQGVSMFIGPFGYGLAAYEYMHKSGGDSARVSAVEQLSQENTGPIRDSLTAALTDKDPAVRAAAAKALGDEHDQDLASPLYALLDDPKQPVRLTAAAACINSLTRVPPNKRPARRPARTPHHADAYNSLQP